MTLSEKKQTKKNIILAGSQIIVSGLTLFILYRYLLETIGLELIGVWSIVMAFSAFLRTGDFGFAGSIVKFVSVSEASSDSFKTLKIIKTSISAAAVGLTILLCIIYPVIPMVLSSFVGGEYIQQAQELLPYSLLSVWFSVMGVLLIFVFDGFNRVDIRSVFLVVLNLVLVVLSIFLVEEYGFVGLGYAQLLHSIIFMLSAWLLVNVKLNVKLLVPFGFDVKVFKEMFSYSLNLQVSSVLAMLLEPLTKLLLVYFGSLSNVAYFEMVNKLIMQVRNVIVSANQAIVPVLAKKFSLQQDMLKGYRLNLKVLIVASILVYPSIVLLLPIIAELWIGKVSEEFLLFGYIISIALAINTLDGAAYFTNMSTGDVKYNTYSQLITAIASLFLGGGLGVLLEGNGVVLSYGLAIIIGSVWLIYEFHNRYRNPPINKENSCLNDY